MAPACFFKLNLRVLRGFPNRIQLLLVPVPPNIPGMGEFSLTHWAVILVIVMVLFGPSKLPGLGKGMGEAIRGFKKGLNEDLPSAADITDPNRQLGSATKPSAPARATSTAPIESVSDHLNA